MADSVRYALAVNGSIAAAKGGAALLTGSPAMMAEATHSAVDCTTQALLWVGDRRGATRPTAPYVWGAAAAACMFATGGVYNVWHGVASFGDHTSSSALMSLVMCAGLIGASALEFTSMVNALRNLRASRNGTPWLQHLRTTTDTASKTVICEDGADIAGNVIALVGIGAAAVSGVHWVDALASIAVGVLLIVLAVELVTHNVRLARA